MFYFRYTDLLREEEFGLNKVSEKSVNGDVKLPQGGAIHRMQTDISKLTPLAKKQTGGKLMLFKIFSRISSEKTIDKIQRILETVQGNLACAKKLYFIN